MEVAVYPIGPSRYQEKVISNRAVILDHFISAPTVKWRQTRVVPRNLPSLNGVGGFVYLITIDMGVFNR